MHACTCFLSYAPSVISDTCCSNSLLVIKKDLSAIVTIIDIKWYIVVVTYYVTLSMQVLYLIALYIMYLHDVESAIYALHGCGIRPAADY